MAIRGNWLEASSWRPSTSRNATLPVLPRPSRAQRVATLRGRSPKCGCGDEGRCHDDNPSCQETQEEAPLTEIAPMIWTRLPRWQAQWSRRTLTWSTSLAPARRFSKEAGHNPDTVGYGSGPHQPRRRGVYTTSGKLSEFDCTLLAKDRRAVLQQIGSQLVPPQSTDSATRFVWLSYPDLSSCHHVLFTLILAVSRVIWVTVVCIPM